MAKKKSENKVNALIVKLLSLGRTDDLAKAATNESFRNKLYKEFQIN